MSTAAVEGGLMALQGVQIAFLLLHDWVPLGTLTNLHAVASSDSRARLLWTTALSALPFVAPFALCCIYWSAPHWPMWLVSWLRYTYGICLVMVLLVWWRPYLLGGSPERAARYRARCAGTARFLPERHGFAPDTLHVVYHLTILATLVLLILL